MRAASAILFAILTLPVFGNTPEEIVTKYLDAIVSGELDDVGKYFHPDDLATFRAGIEPTIAKAVRNRTDRQMFGAFIDPYNPKTLRPLTDEEFMSAFARWIQIWKKDTFSMISQTKFTVLGHVPDGDKNQVVVRLKTDYKGKPWETMIFRATKEFEGEHRLLITHEINTAADFMRENL